MVVILSGWVSGHAFGGGLLFNVIGLPAALLYALPSPVTQGEVPQQPGERVTGEGGVECRDPHGDTEPSPWVHPEPTQYVRDRKRVMIFRL